MSLEKGLLLLAEELDTRIQVSQEQIDILESDSRYPADKLKKFRIDLQAYQTALEAVSEDYQ